MIRKYKEIRQIDEYTKHPMFNFADAIDRSLIGDIKILAKGSLLNRSIISVIAVIFLYIFLKLLKQ